jgi:hypothetical protein
VLVVELLQTFLVMHYVRSTLNNRKNVHILKIESLGGFSWPLSDLRFSSINLSLIMPKLSCMIL